MLKGDKVSPPLYFIEPVFKEFNAAVKREIRVQAYDNSCWEVNGRKSTTQTLCKFNVRYRDYKTNYIVYILCKYKQWKKLRNKPLRKLWNLIILYKLRLFKSREEGMSECVAWAGYNVLLLIRNMLGETCVSASNTIKWCFCGAADQLWPGPPDSWDL